MDEGGVPPETGGYDAEEDLLPGSSSSSEGRRKRRRKTKSARHHHQKVTRISSPAPRIMDGDLAVETCHFHWPNHLPHILASFEALLTEETFCDVTLICGDEMVPLRAHRLVLSACSDYFERILTENPCSQAVIVLKDFAVWEVEALLDWMYRGQVGVTEENGDALVSTAKSLQIRGLAESLLWHINPPSKIPKIDNFSPENSNPATTPLNLSRPTISSPNKEEQDPYHHSVPTSGLVSFQEENSPHNPLDFTRVQNHSPPPTRSSIPLPRRKQARPRRRSGDFIAQDLRKPSPASGFLSREQSDAEEHVAFRFDDDDDEEDDPFVFDEDFAHDHDPGMNDRSSLEGEVFSSVSPKEEEDENEEKFLRRTRRSSRFLYDDEYDEDDGEFEGHEILDYTMPPSNTLSSREERGTDLKQTAREERVLLPPGTVGNGSLHQQNLVFLRGYNPTMAQGGKFMNPGEIHHHHRNNNLNHHKGPFSPPVRSPFPLNADPLLASFPFLPGLLPPPPHLPLSSPTGKRNPSPLSPAPSLPPNSFLSTSGAIQITPLGGDPESPHKTTPTTNSSPAEFSPGGQTHESGSKQQVQSSSRNGGKQVNRNHYHHHHHPHWPGISPLGPPPIFGRHRAQHSAPRGGPPRAWSNADLTEALHNVWNKKMTTSQASRIFGIPYNSLLMYVRGKYGKSLKLDVLKKGLDQAMENSNIAAAAAAAAAATSLKSSPNKTPSNGTPLPPTTTSPLTTNNSSPVRSINNSTTPPSPTKKQGPNSALLHSLHLNGNNKIPETNNNNSHTPHPHPHGHHHSHHKSSHGKLLQSNGNVVNVESHLPQDPHPMGGFNPFFFPDFGNPFPFASALQHILPPHLAGHHNHHVHHHVHNNNKGANHHGNGRPNSVGQQQQEHHQIRQTAASVLLD